MNKYTNILREHNLKATPQRLAIADILMLKKFSSISLATIYKNINLMLENSFIQEVKIPNAKSVYELTKNTHSHLVCQKCGEVEDITLDLNNIIKSASKKSDFIVNKTDFILSGVCHNCKKQ